MSAPKFEVGQKIVALETQERITAGETYIVQGISKGLCGEDNGDLVDPHEG